MATKIKDILDSASTVAINNGRGATGDVRILGGAQVQNQYGSGITQNGKDFIANSPKFSPDRVGGAITRSGIISQDGTTPITSDSLASQTPMVTPNAPVQTSALGLSTQAEQYAKGSKVTADAEQARLDKQQEQLQSSEQSIADLISGVGEQGAKKVQAYQDEGLIEIKKTSDSIRTAMESANLATRRRIEELQKNNPEGQSLSAMNAQIRDIEAKNASYQADQAIVLSATNRDFETAKSFIDAKVDAETEGMKAQIEARTFLYENNKDRFTKAEQRKIEADLLEQKRTYDETIASKKTLEETKLEAMKNAQEQNAPNSVLQAISKSTTPEQVITNAGRYGIKSVKKIGTSTNGTVSSTSQAIIDNPSLFDDLTPTVKGEIITELHQAGYDTSNLGVKGLSDTAIISIAQTQKALDDLGVLKDKLRGNTEFLGPISGLQALNPYSKARQIQADVDRVRQTVGKALEGGVLRKEDEEKYKKILSTLTDTPATAEYKIDALITSIQRDVESFKSLQQSSGRSIDVSASLQKKGVVTDTKDLRTKYGY